MLVQSFPKLAAAEKRLRSAKVAAAVAEMRVGGASEHAIAVYEAEKAVEEAKLETAEVTLTVPCRVKPRAR